MAEVATVRMAEVATVADTEEVATVAEMALAEVDQAVRMAHISATEAMTINRIGMSRRRLLAKTRGTEMVHTMRYPISTQAHRGLIRDTAILEPVRRPAFTIHNRITLLRGNDGRC